MKTNKKQSLHGKQIEKKDLGQYSKSLGKKPLYNSGVSELHERLYE